MKNLYQIKQISVVALIIIIMIVVFMVIGPKKEQELITNNDNVVTDTGQQEPINICYYRATKTDRGFYDKAWLKLNLLNEKITGEFYNLPSESDSKVGTFEGIILTANSTVYEKKATVWWESRAEGMEVKEELAIKFGDESATVGFGEMVDSQLGDGVYLYKDKSNLYYIEPMNQIDCESLEEKLSVEKYLRDNIENIATNKPVLGGTWYVVSTTIIPATKTGEVTYEDGHIQSKATFNYLYEPSSQKITITKFDIKK